MIYLSSADGGKEVTVTIVDRCTACAFYDLDFSRGAFDVLADEALGRISITWEWANGVTTTTTAPTTTTTIPTTTTTPTTTTAPTTTSTTTTSPAATTTASSGSCASVAAWVSTTAYNGGEEVTYSESYAPYRGQRPSADLLIPRWPPLDRKILV